MHLEQQTLIMIFLASLEMNPRALHGVGLDHDSLRGKRINQYKSIPFYFDFILQLRNFGTHLISQIYYNLLSYRHEGFTEEYTNRKFKIQTTSRVAQASEDEQHLRCSPQFVCVLRRRFRAKQRLLVVS